MWGADSGQFMRNIMGRWGMGRLVGHESKSSRSEPSHEGPVRHGRMLNCILQIIGNVKLQTV